MRISYRDGRGRDRSGLASLLVEAHRWLPGRIAEWGSWKLAKIFRLATGNTIKWSAFSFEGDGTLRARGDFRIAAGARFQIETTEVEFGERVYLDHGVTLRAFGPARIRFGSHVYVGVNAYLDGRGGVTIGDRVQIGPQTTIVSFNHATIVGEPDTMLGIAIGNGVWIGANVVVLDGVTIGDGAVVAAGAVVRSDVAPRTVVGGVPARFLRAIGEPSTALEPSF